VIARGGVLALALLLAAPAPAAPALRLHVGAQLGFPHLIGATALTTFYFRGRPRFDVDALWEPSNRLQSYSVGATYHPADRMFFLGARLRLMQLAAPWGRGYDAATDNHLGIGMELGVRPTLGRARRVVLSVSLQGTALPTATPQQQWLFGLNVGVFYTVWISRPTAPGG